MYCNCFLTRLWRHKFESNFFILIKPFFQHDKKVKTKTWWSWEQKELLRWKSKYFSSFLKGFSCQKLSQTSGCAFKSTYTKLEPKVLRKRQYKNFSKESFIKDLKLDLSKDSICNHFNNEFKEILHHHVPRKETKLCGNTKPHVNKILRK